MERAYTMPLRRRLISVSNMAEACGNKEDKKTDRGGILSA